MPSINIDIPEAPSNVYATTYRALDPSSHSSASSSPSRDSFFAASSYSSTTSVDSTDLYIPLHKQSGSNANPTKHCHIYLRDALLALADSTTFPLHVSIRSTLRETCPDIVTIRKMWKSMEYKRSQLEAVKKVGHTPSPEPPPRTGGLPMLRRSPALEHGRTGVVTARKPALEPERKTGVPSAQRNPNAGRSKAVECGPERRKNALKAVSEDVNWRTRSGPLPVPQVIIV